MRSRILLFAGLLLPLLLAACAGGGGHRSPRLAPALPSADWSADMARFAADDRAARPPTRPVVFTGSSSVRLWTSLAADLPGIAVLNRGFGGSELRDAIHHADAIAIRYRPSRIVLYAGDNDIAAGRTPRQVEADFRAFVARVRRELPEVPVSFIAIKPSPARAHLLPVQAEANARVAAAARAMRGVDYVDVATPMLGAERQPRGELFLADGLHLNAAGYALWRELLSRHLGAGEPAALTPR